MSRYVNEIMNPELFFLRPADTVGSALLAILSLGVTAAPVVDSERRPAGVVSLRDLISDYGGEFVGERMTSPAATVPANAEIPDAGRKLAELGVHRLIVVDEEGRAIGIVSSLDLLRALLDMPVRHPAAFPHQDAEGVSWSDPVELDAAKVDVAPEGPGLFVLVHDEVGRASIPLWAEAATSVRTRLSALLAAPHEEDAWLRRILEKDTSHLRFRVAAVADPARRAASLERARERIASAAGLPT